MKQSAAKSLGVAALGAAFAAAAAGTASAAPAVLPAPAPSLDSVTSVLPVQDALTHTLPTAQSAAPVASLLGGLPADGLPIGDVGILPVGDGLHGIG